MYREHIERAGRYQDCKPKMLCGRKVWIAERGGTSSLKEIWIHLSPFKRAALYLKGSSLTDGDAASNLAYLERLCRDTIEQAAPLSRRLEEIWNADTAEQAMYDRLYEQELAQLDAAGC